MSSSTNTEIPSLPNPTIVANISDEPVSSRDCSIVLRGAPERVNAFFKAKDISPDSVTSPLEALALACVHVVERETEDQLPSSECEEKTFTDSDVLCGRGGLTNNAKGNVFFRRMVRIKQESYLLASKRQKAGVAREIVEMVRALDPPGRFLKKDTNGVWVEIGDRKAREKTSQALREGAPELRQELQTADEQLRVGTPPPIIAPTSVVHSTFLHPRKFFKPDPRFDNGNHIMSSNRVRIVSDDSVVGIRLLLQNQNDPVTGSKRKVKEEMDAEQDTTKRGPRLKLLKSRVMV
jgi:hypothetical protein